ncbi:MAG: hypothetical protein EU541_03195 [Promethearchaeota archaeon]|nr:MAG: hypothetical protein EU541_03195 [Candidatus Lokiarchaeota archaeon]
MSETEPKLSKNEGKTIEERESGMSSNTQLVLKIAGAAIFGALSILLSFLSPILLRIGPGMAIFDPVSIPWTTSFIIFGPLAGILCSLIGFVGLIPFDTSIPVIGPFMKFMATFTLIVIYILVLRLYKKEEGKLLRPKLKKPKNYILVGLLAIGFRLIVMEILNTIVYIGLGLPIAGLTTWLIWVAIINSIQSIWDLAIPYLLIFPTRLNEMFEIW